MSASGQVRQKTGKVAWSPFGIITLTLWTVKTAACGTGCYLLSLLAMPIVIRTARAPTKVASADSS